MTNGMMITEMTSGLANSGTVLFFAKRGMIAITMRAVKMMLLQNSHPNSNHSRLVARTGNQVRNFKGLGANCGLTVCPRDPALQLSQGTKGLQQDCMQHSICNMCQNAELLC